MKTAYLAVEAYMLASINDAAHNEEHVYRVLNYAMEIARHEREANLELLTIACLLHDIARAEQFADSSKCHAMLGGEKAHDWLLTQGYTEDFASAVQHCIQTHRFRSNNPPQSIEAKILFDADKLDVCGTIGVARTFFYIAHANEPEPLGAFLREYEFKLAKLYDKFYTKRGAELAAKRQKAARDFYEALLSEVNECYGDNT